MKRLKDQQMMQLGFIILSFSISLVFCTQNGLVLGQDSDLENFGQDFHQDIGRISGGATQNLAKPAARAQPVVRQQNQQTQAITHQSQSEQLSSRPSSNTNRNPIGHQVNAKPVSWSSHASQQAPQQAPKKNRITLHVRPHTPIHQANQQVSFAQATQPAAAPALVEAAPAPLPVAITQPISAPLQPINVPSNSDPNSYQFASLMAQVAAERQAQAKAQFSASSSEPTLDASPEGRQSLASIPNAVQVIAPPVIAAPEPSTFKLNQNVDQASQLSAAGSIQFGNQPEEQIEAPTFQHVLSKGCPRKGVFSWEHKDHCDRYYMCTNGTFTEEACPNGLSYSQMGAVYQHCAYNWNVDCGRKVSPGPHSSPGCPWQFGIFPTNSGAQCSIDYFVCEWGVPEKKRCQPEGLFYDDRIKGCQWPDQLGCKSEALLNFKCPAEDEDNPFWPYPRYYHTKQDIIVCVNDQPRLVHCTDEQVVEPSSLSCLDLKKKSKKKF